GQAATVMVNGLTSMIIDFKEGIKRYRAGIDQHGGQLDDKNDVIQQLVGPVVWELLEKDLSELRNANNQMKVQLEEAESRLKSQEQQVSQLQRKTRCDPLTGVMNRFAMAEDLFDELARCKRYGRQFGLVMADIDHFKRINDSYGHAVGDEALKSFVRMLRSCLREVDVIYRYGGEEFVVLLPETDSPGTMLVAERLRRMVESQVMKHREDASLQVRFTASFGVAIFRGDEFSWEEIIQRADQALYRAKNNGRNRVESEM
ncbi:MAG: GGDEF domain-containing protein, partial [Desulfobulbaceae bacterium]|nr:GGDEF domain-containing protein [Desulfobulbaceae bacterium]